MREIELPPSRKSRALHLPASVAKKNARLLVNLDSNLPVTHLNGFSDLVNYAPRADEPVHRWFPYREGYSTKLVSRLIDEMPRTQRILDPFCGCGTTLIAGQKLGFGCDGLEVNPLSVLVTRVKTRHYSKVELWMGGFVRSYQDMQRLNRRALRSHVETPLKRPTDEEIGLVEEFIELIDPDKLWDSRITQAIRGYFVDMSLVMRNLFRVLKGNARCVMVVGNSAYGGILIPTDSLLAAISRTVGFVVENIGVARHLTTSSQQKLVLEDRKNFLRESVVVLRKPKWIN